MTEDQRIQFENQGFLHMPGTIPPDLVRRVRTAFDSAVERSRRDGLFTDGMQYFDIPDILDVDDAFVDLADLPSIKPVLLEAVGPDIQLNHTHARIFPPGPTFTAPWHSDLAAVLGIDLAHSIRFMAKVHFYFEDLRPDQGCLAFLPGTHRLPPEHPRPDIAPDSPVAVKIVPKAGDTVLFNTHLMHMALDNTSPIARKSLIYAYSHFWVKHYANSVPSDIERVANTPYRKQLFGVETPGVAYFNQRADEPVPMVRHTSLASASKRLIKRIMRATSVTRR